MEFINNNLRNLYKGLCLFLILWLVSCAVSKEKKADRYLKQGHVNRAYQLYLEALQRNSESIPLREKFLKTTFTKINETIAENDYKRIDLYLKDIDQYIAGTPQFYKDELISVLITLADSLFNNGSDLEAFQYLQQARMTDSTNAKILSQWSTRCDQYGLTMLNMAKEYIQIGKSQDDAESYVRAEYYALCAKKYIPENNNVNQVLQILRKVNLSSYSVYNKLLDKTEEDVDIYDIYMSISDKSVQNNLLYLKVHFYNDSYNPVNIGYDHFQIVTTNGKKYPAMQSSNFPKKLLDNETEITGTLAFNLPPAERQKLMKLVFEDTQIHEVEIEGKMVEEKEEHSSEKLFP